MNNARIDNLTKTMTVFARTLSFAPATRSAVKATISPRVA